MPDPRIVTAIAYAVIGVSAVVLGLRVLATHPINRVFALGAFLTEEGMRALLRVVPLLIALGMFAIASALSRLAYWQAGVDHASSGWPHFFGVIETVFALWAAISLARSVWQLCRKG